MRGKISMIAEYIRIIIFVSIHIKIYTTGFTNHLNESQCIVGNYIITLQYISFPL